MSSSEIKYHDTFETIEPPYFDFKGKEIKEFSVLKVYHFKGVNERGQGRKIYYMYKWVRLKEFSGKMYWVAMHLTTDDPQGYYNLRAVADKETRIIKGTEIVQQLFDPHPIVKEGK